MIRLLVISDFTESFTHKFLAGIVKYSRRKEQWVIRRMPPFYKARIGIPGVIRVAKDWEVDAVVGQFEPTEDLGEFARNGIIVIDPLNPFSFYYLFRTFRIIAFIQVIGSIF